MPRWKKGWWKGGKGQKEVKEEVDSDVGYLRSYSSEITRYFKRRKLAAPNS